MRIRLAIAISATTLAASTTANAQTDDGFYKGKTIDFYIGWGAGGGYDVYGRLVARHMGKHIPGRPNIIARNMEGAGSLRLANWLYNVAPKDGLAFGTVARGIAFETLFGTPGTQFDGTKFNWIGSANNDVSVSITWHNSGIVTLQDMLTKTFIAGGVSGASDDNIVYLINGILGAKIKPVMGYPGGNDINLAMERGEVQGRVTTSWSTIKANKGDWLKDKKINVPVQLSLTKHADLPDVPSIMEATRTPEQQQIFRLVLARNIMGRPFFAPPGLPNDRTATLRRAFMETMQDREFLAEAEKAGLEINPVRGEEIQALMQDAYVTPADIVKKTATLLKGPE
jgi:tripartite-type tricarboxylate transporter receptor subunit TctC